MLSHSGWAAAAKSIINLFICVFILFRESDEGAMTSSHKTSRPSGGIALNAFPNSTKARLPACSTLSLGVNVVKEGAVSTDCKVFAWFHPPGYRTRVCLAEADALSTWPFNGLAY